MVGSGESYRIITAAISIGSLAIGSCYSCTGLRHGAFRAYSGSRDLHRLNEAAWFPVCMGDRLVLCKIYRDIQGIVICYIIMDTYSF